VARLCRRSGQTPQTGIHERLGTKAYEFLKFNDRQVLPNAGNVSKQEADDFARNEYDRVAERRRQYKESLGEAESIKALEEAATQLGTGHGRKVILSNKRDKERENKKKGD